MAASAPRLGETSNSQENVTFTRRFKGGRDTGEPTIIIIKKKEIQQQQLLRPGVAPFPFRQGDPLGEGFMPHFVGGNS